MRRPSIRSRSRTQKFARNVQVLTQGPIQPPKRSSSLIPFKLKMMNRTKPLNPKAKPFRPRNSNGNNMPKSLTATETSASASNLVSAPVFAGTVMTNSTYMRMSGAPLRSIEHEPGTRVVGSGFFHYNSTGYVQLAIPLLTLISSSSTPLAGAAFTNGGAVIGDQTNDYLRRITPATMGNRVAVIASCFGFYAFRRLDLKWVPSVPTTTIGSIAFALLRDTQLSTVAMPTVAVDGLGTVEGVLSFNPACMAPVWEPCSVSYTYNGQKAWAGMYGSALNPLQTQQLAISACFTGLAAGPVSYGRFTAQYVIDFYEPVPQIALNLLASPALPERSVAERVRPSPVNGFQVVQSIPEDDEKELTLTPKRSASAPSRPKPLTLR